MGRSETVMEASFHPNLRWYRYLQGVIGLIGSVVGIPVLPVWLVAGWWWSTRYYESLECQLGESTLSIGYGVWFRTEKSIPLEQIQDLSVRHGPLLNWLGLTKLKVKTAGESSGTQAAGSLDGVVEPIAFRDRVLEQRERTSERKVGAPAGPPAEEGEATELLAEIRDAVVRIEERLAGGPATEE